MELWKLALNAIFSNISRTSEETVQRTIKDRSYGRVRSTSPWARCTPVISIDHVMKSALKMSSQKSSFQIST